MIDEADYSGVEGKRTPPTPSRQGPSQGVVGGGERRTKALSGGRVKVGT